MGTLALGACGFQPAFTNVSQNRFFGKLAYSEPNSRETLALNRQLTVYFGKSDAPEYFLETSLTFQSATLNVTQSSAQVRARITAICEFSLRALRNDRELLSQSLQRTASISRNSDKRYAATQAEMETKTRLARAIADDIALKITASNNI